MPELPEVEVIARGLRPLLLGCKIDSIFWSGKPLRLEMPIERLKRELPGCTIMDVRRRAKYIECQLDTGSILLVHLGMTGNLGVFTSTSPRIRHDHFEWVLDNNSVLRYNDIRRFGSIRLLDQDEAVIREQTIYNSTGPEPFSEEFSEQYLFAIAKKRDLPVKGLIMNNVIVAGVGNIYANESLFEAGIRPTKKAKRLSKAQCQQLIQCIRRVLAHAIECGGSTISDFKNASQQQGYFQMNFKVYGKEGLPCKRCDSIIKRVKIGGRASFYCAKCQK